MSRLILALGVAAAFACILWAHAPRAPISRSAETSVATSMPAIAAIEDLGTQAGAAAARSAPSASSAAVAPVRSAPTPSADVPALEATMRIAADGGAAAPDVALDLAAMQELARREAEGLVTVRNADGSETLNHEGRFVDYTVIRMGPDGKPVLQCVHGDAGVAHAMRAHPAPATPREERP